jgi:magnesium-transporting ATPase (P-type)
MSTLVTYVFYKNILFSIGQFWFNFNNAWSGQKYYTEAVIQMFNVIFTSVPILLYGSYDRDMAPRFPEKAYPQLYTLCINDFYFNTRLFWGWIGDAIFDSIIMSVMPLYFLEHADFRDGLQSFWTAGALTCTAILTVCNIKLLFFQNRWDRFQAFFLVLSIGTWFAVAFAVSSLILVDYDWFQVFHHACANPNFWLGVIWLLSVIVMKDTFMVAVRRQFYPTPPMIIQEMDKFQFEARSQKESIWESVPDDEYEHMPGECIL